MILLNERYGETDRIMNFVFWKFRHG